MDRLGVTLRSGSQVTEVQSGTPWAGSPDLGKRITLTPVTKGGAVAVEDSDLVLWTAGAHACPVGLGILVAV